MKDTVRDVLGRFGCDPSSSRVESLGNAGGMSGARLWKILSKGHARCLRQWPEVHPTYDQLDWIHAQLGHARNQACRFVPVVHRQPGGTTIVRQRGRLWELTDWMPGKADFDADPSDDRLVHAVTCVARLHVALRSSDMQRAPGEPAGVANRRRMLDQCSTQQLDEWHGCIDLRHGMSTAETCRRILSHASCQVAICRERIAGASGMVTELQPCLRDVWHDHLLFSGPVLTGIVDYGAMGVDSPAGDIARMLGSLVPDRPKRWRTALDAYEQVRSLSRTEHELLAAFDYVNPVLSGLNWIRWLYIENRHFDSNAVTKRLAFIDARLQAAVS